MVFTKAAGRGGEQDKKCESVAERESNPIAFAPGDFADPWHGRGCSSCAEIAAPSFGEGLAAQKSTCPAPGAQKSPRPAQVNELDSGLSARLVKLVS